MKFERFIFDALPLAQRWTMVETDRAVEFEPLEERDRPRLAGHGPPADERPARRLARARRGDGPAPADGSVPFGIEISPLFALDAAELKRKLEPGLVVEGPLYLR